MKVAETLNITKAAEEVGMTQSGLSKSIKNIEQELGVELFSRDKKNLRLTTAGVAFFAEVNHFLINCKHIQLGEETGGNTPMGTLSILYTNRAQQIIDFMDVFYQINKICREKYPGISIRLKRESGYTTVANVLSNKVDVGFMMQSSAVVNDPRGLLETFTIMKDIPLMVALPKDHPLANANSLTLEDFKNENIILIEASGQSEEQRALYTIFNHYGYIPHIAHTATDYESMYMLIGSGYGIALVPHSPICRTHPNVVYVPIRPVNSQYEEGIYSTYKLVMAYPKSNSNPILPFYIEVAETVLSKYSGIL
ncbi:MAG: LysR family transcriptional regulator [Anaerovoracaceae bacterium]